MDVDLFTWGAQIVNFLILVGLLRHFLYGRIVNAIDTRQENIESRWNEAEQEKERAEQKAEEYGRKQEELERRRDEILAQAKDDARAQKEEWRRQAREEIDRLRSNWQESLDQDKRSFLEDLRRATADEITKILRRVLHDFANARLEQQVVHRFTKELNDSGERAESLKGLVREGDRALTVRTSFKLAKGARDELQKAIDKALGGQADLKFAASDEVLCGIELRANGQKIAWSVQGYLDAFDERIGETFEQRTLAGGQKESAQERQPQEKQDENAD
jgi:F-type H+-transporting ATPase subunit b